MTDIAYLCHNCGSVHEVESIRENLILDLRSAASYELSGQGGMLARRARFLRWRMSRSLSQALWPGYSHHPPLARRLRLLKAQPAAVSDRPGPFLPGSNWWQRCAHRSSGSSRPAGHQPAVPDALARR